MNNADKKLGRRKAGSWGRTRKAGKRIANKATRKAGKPTSTIETPEKLRRVGFSDALNGVYRPESIAKGWARDAYRDGKNQAELFNTLGDKA